MFRTILVSISLMLFLGFLGGCKDEEQPQEPVYSTIFADTNLDQLVREAIGKLEGDLVASDVDTITRLDAGFNNISSLAGMEYMTNLRWLDIYDDPIQDISPLSGLTLLDTLRARANPISDFSPLSSLSNLRWLCLIDAGVRDLTFLSSLESLEVLDFHDEGSYDFNDITDCEPLSNLLSLRQLNLSSNENLSNVSCLSTLSQLDHLSLGDCPIQDAVPISSCTGLRYLDLSYTSITDLAPLHTLSQIETLRIASLQLTSLEPLSQLTNLADLDIGYAQITDLSPLASLPNLSALNLTSDLLHYLPSLGSASAISFIGLRSAHNGWRQDAVNCDYLVSLSHLQTVYISGMQIDNLAALGTVSTLHRLIVDFDCAIPNYSDLSALTHLTYLQIRGAPAEWPILNLSPLEPLTELDTLKLAGVGAAYCHIDEPLDHVSYMNLALNGLESIGFISEFPNVHWVDVSGNQITDIFDLIDHPFLGAGDYLNLGGNPLNDISRTNYIPILQARGVIVYY